MSLRLPVATCVLSALVFLGCNKSPASLDAPDATSDPFDIVLSEHPAEPDQPPALDGDTLLVRVRYGGGCEDHTFRLDQTVRSDTTVLALRHDDGGDDCEALVFDELRLALPEAITTSGPVLLRNPAGGVPFVLR